MSASQEEKATMHAIANQAAAALTQHGFDGCMVHIFHNGSSSMALGFRETSAEFRVLTLRATHTALMSVMSRNNVQPDSGDYASDVEMKQYTLRKEPLN